MSYEDLSEEDKKRAEQFNIDFEKIEEISDEVIDLVKKNSINFREGIILLHKLHMDLNSAYVENSD